VSECESYSVADQNKYVIKFDSACSANMSGVKGRLIPETISAASIIVKGFNGQTSKADQKGKNTDGKVEYYLSSMPPRLSLLCAHDYVQDGAAILFPDSGYVLKLNLEEQEKLKKFTNSVTVVKQLQVKNKTYEVDQEFGMTKNNLLIPDNPCTETNILTAENISVQVGQDKNISCSKYEESNLSATATRYFNSKINVSDDAERILATLLTGISFKDLISMVQHASIDGLPRDITLSSLKEFETAYGRAPDVIQLATPNLAGNKKGYMAPKLPVTTVGQRIEVDYFESEFNERVALTDPGKFVTKKLPTHGGAIAAFLTVDCYSHYVTGQLVTAMSKSLDKIKTIVTKYRSDGHSLKELAADSGVVHPKNFKINLSTIEEYLVSQGIKCTVAEAYNHNNGTPIIERNVRTVKELMRFAVLYIFNNPNFLQFRFTKRQVLQLWGELFHWALVVINLKPCTNCPRKTKYEVYHGHRPDLRRIRLLPIFSHLYVLREKPHVDLSSNHSYWQRGLYVGPSLEVPGAIRCAVITNGRLLICTTTRFKAVSDGGQIDIYPIADRQLQYLSHNTSSEVPISDTDNAITTTDQGPDQTPQYRSTIEQIYDSTPNVINESPPSPLAVNPDPVLATAPAHTTNVESPVIVSTLRGDSEVRRSNRVRKKKVSFDYVAKTAEEVLECMFLDWTEHEEDSLYYSFSDNAFMVIENEIDGNILPLEGYRAVTEGVPRTFAAALKDPKWGEPARIEFNTIMHETKAVVEIDQRIAQEHIQNGAEVLRMLAVYEEKIKEGKLVYKVRLVADGRQHKIHGATYSATPTREELLVLLSIFAHYRWDYYHVDEVRAFLNAKKKDPRPTLVKFSGDQKYYEIVGALYGTKTAPRDYQEDVATRFTNLGYERLSMCSCIYLKRLPDAVVFVYDYVDDFVFGGSSTEVTEQCVAEFQSLTKTTQPIKNAEKLLGMTLTRLPEKHLITISMIEKINELTSLHPKATSKRRNIPMPSTGYAVRESDFEKLSKEKQAYLDKDGIETYMSIVGKLIWIQGVRLDIIFTVLYLSWFTKKPRHHHLDMAYYCIGYLHTTKYLPLVLGSIELLELIGYSDASLGTGPKSRSIAGQLLKMNSKGGAIFAKAVATTSVRLSSFEAELDACAMAMKSFARINNILEELGLKTGSSATLFSDNKAMIEFVHGNSAAKGCRHMELRLWYTREQYQKGNAVLRYMEGKAIPADKLTKLGNIEEHKRFTSDILGLSLLEFDYYSIGVDTVGNITI
jgi:hypothetical protein